MISIKKGIEDFKEHYKRIKDGYNPGIITPYKYLNEALFNGFPKNTVNAIAAHSGRGKTTLALNILFNAPKLNENVEVLFFSLEMPVKALIARNASTKLRLTVKELYNSAIELEDDLFKDLEDLPIYFEETSGSPEHLYKTIDAFCNSRPNKEVLVGIDHTLLVEGREDGEKIAQLCLVLNKLKIKHKNLTSVIISQLNDAMLSEKRLMQKGVLLHPQYSDLYYGRQLYMVCDTVLVLNIPSVYMDKASAPAKIGKEYGGLPLFYKQGPKEVPLIYGHIIKGRDTGNNVLSFVSALKYNELLEIKTPE